MVQFAINDWVMPTLEDWKEQGFIEPKRIYNINNKNKCALLGINFDSCYLGYLRHATDSEIQELTKLKKNIFCEYELSKIKQEKINQVMVIEFNTILVNYCLN